MGTLNLLNTVFQQRVVEKVDKHPGFSASTKTNDIAILTLEQEADVSDPQQVYPACLHTRTGALAGDVTVSGWGKTEGKIFEQHFLD